MGEHGRMANAGQGGGMGNVGKMHAQMQQCCKTITEAGWPRGSVTKGEVGVRRIVGSPTIQWQKSEIQPLWKVRRE